jgi:DNA-binding response OmpR family regulator
MKRHYALRPVPVEGVHRCPNCGHRYDGAKTYGPRMDTLNLSPTCFAILQRVARGRGGVVSVDDIAYELYAHRNDPGPENPEQVVKVMAYRIRERLTGTGWTIEGLRRGGYRLVRA